MSVLPVGFGSSGGLEITNSLRLRASASAYLSRTFGAPTTQNTYTWSGWVKRGKLAVLQNLFGVSTNHSLGFPAADTLVLTIAGAAAITSTPLYRDPSAWYHILYSQSGTSASLQVNNGTAMTATVTSSVFNTAVAHQLGAANTSNYVDGYLSDVYFVDGQALTPSSFGETDSNGVWVPKAYTGTYGTNGFHLDFKDAALTAGSNAGLGKDVSGNGNYWTTNNISVTAGVTYDSMVDTPTNNYATLNPIVPVNGVTLTDGNLTSSMTTISTIAPRGAIAVSSGKWYWEITKTDAVAAGHNFGIIDVTQAETVNNFTGTNSVGYYSSNGNRYLNGTSAAYGTSYTTNDVIGVELDLDSGTQTIRFYKNNTVQAAGAYINLTSGLTWVPTDNNGGGGTVTAGWNFGQRPFTYTPPTGYKALCTANLPAVAITKPALHFDAKTRTGTGAAFNVTGIGFSPDLVWSKGRSGATDHAIYDAVRGATYDIGSNLATDQTTQAQGVTAFNSDGFSGGTLAKINTNAATYIDWMWKESVTAGLDIVAVTGNGANRTVAHNLGVVPSMIIGKSLTTAGADTGWPVYHASLANTEYLKLETTAAKATGATYWNSTTPTSSVFSLGTAADVNTNNDTYIYYVFAEIPGYSKFGSYVGNGSADGPFVYCGFRPRYVLIKNTGYDASQAWVIHDTARAAYNLDNVTLQPNSSNAESTVFGADIDVTANGFKIRNSNTVTNASGTTIIYAAFAEHPQGGSNVAPSPAR